MKVFVGGDHQAPDRPLADVGDEDRPCSVERESANQDVLDGAAGYETLTQTFPSLSTAMPLGLTPVIGMDGGNSSAAAGTTGLPYGPVSIDATYSAGSA